MCFRRLHNCLPRLTCEWNVGRMRRMGSQCCEWIETLWSAWCQQQHNVGQCFFPIEAQNAGELNLESNGSDCFTIVYDETLPVSVTKSMINHNGEGWAIAIKTMTVSGTHSRFRLFLPTHVCANEMSNVSNEQKTWASTEHLEKLILIARTTSKSHKKSCFIFSSRTVL